MKVYQMNENDFILHNSLSEAITYYDGITGTFEENKDSSTGTEFEVDQFKVGGFDQNEERVEPITVKEAIEKGLTGIPDLFSYEY